MLGTIVESMRLLGQLSHALDNIAGKGIPLQEPMVIIPLSEYEKLREGRLNMEDIHATTLADLATISGNHIFDAEMNRLMMRNAELQEIENLKNRKRWRIFK